MHIARRAMEKATRTGWSLRRLRERVLRAGARLVVPTRRLTLMLSSSAAPLPSQIRDRARNYPRLVPEPTASTSSVNKLGSRCQRRVKNPQECRSKIPHFHGSSHQPPASLSQNPSRSPRRIQPESRPRLICMQPDGTQSVIFRTDQVGAQSWKKTSIQMKVSMFKPRITVVTPSFNQGGYIEETIKSVIDQNYEGLQYYVLDGGSTDETRSILEKYDCSIDFWRSSIDGGQSAAIAEGFAKADGDIMCWLNSDDILLPGSLDYVADFFVSHPEIDVLLGGLMYLDELGNITKCYLYPKPRAFFAQRGVIAFGQQSMFIHRRVFERIGNIDQDLHYLMDSDFVHRMIRAEVTFGTARKYLAAFRWHHEMKSTDGSFKKKQETASLIASFAPLHKQKFVARTLFRIEQLANGNYLRSTYSSWVYRRSNLSSMWTKSSNGVDKHE